MNDCTFTKNRLGNNVFKMMAYLRFITALLVLLPLFAHAVIEIDLGIQGIKESPSTLSDKVFVERVELFFPNKNSSQSIPLNSKKLYAIARFKYVGNGALTARWLVDNRVIAQQTMLLTFGKDVEIRSDFNGVSLPSFEKGFHTVALQLINTAGVINETARSIQYFVGDGIADVSTLIPELLYPKNQTVDASDFYFRWKGDRQNKAYVFELEKLPLKSQNNKVIQALSRFDVFVPSDLQRTQLSAGLYRWRVKAAAKERAEFSAWERFSIQESARQAGGVFIQNIQVSNTPTGQNLHQWQQSVSQLDKQSHLTQTQAVVRQANVASGNPYQVQLSIQNTAQNAPDMVQLEVRNNGVLVATHPVRVESGAITDVQIPMLAEQSRFLITQNLSFQVVDNNRVLDTGAVNITIEPQLRLDNLDFNELASTDDGFSITDPNGCSVGEASRNMAFSRIVSAQHESDLAQNVSDNGYFTFEQGQKIRISAFFKDQGLGAWFDGPTGTCLVATGNIRFKGESVGGQRVIRQHPLQFMAQPINALGQASGAPIIIGEVTFATGFEGFLESPLWTIPQAGQYKISLQNLGESTDLYATLPGGYPKYIHAAGFVAELQYPLHAGSQMMAGAPRQAIINGRVATQWKGDANGQTLILTANQLAVTMDNPLHARISGGELSLLQTPDRIIPQLHLYNEWYQLHELTLGLAGAKANLTYQLPASFSQTEVRRLRSVHQPAAITDGIIALNNVNIVNGGEFVAQYEFDQRWDDILINQGNLALRIRGSTFVADASPVLSYTAYTQASSFTGVGLHNALVRVKVTPQNGLFAVDKPQTAYLFGQAQWLFFQNGTLNGDYIQVKPASEISPFDHATIASQWSLLDPLGFDMMITGGEFGLSDSVVSGVNLSGWVQPSQQLDIAEFMDSPFYFNHLVRDQKDPQRFVSENKPLQGLRWHLDAYQYQPGKMQFLLGNVGDAVAVLTLPDRSQAQQWQTELRNFLQQQSGLLATGGALKRSWHALNDDVETGGQGYGTFLLNTSGIHGQWQERDDQQVYEINEFKTRIADLWLKFSNSVLLDSRVNGFLDIPYPVAQSFVFSGKLDQQADLNIPADGLSFPENNELQLAYWQATIKPGTTDTNVLNSDGAHERVDPASFSTIYNPLPIIYNRQLNRIELSNMLLTLVVADDLGGEEFVTQSGQPPFLIDTDILPDGQLMRTQVTPVAEPLYFLGQDFEVSSIRFAPYFATDNADNAVTAQPLVDIAGNVFFKVFGTRQVTIQHTALGAQVPDIQSLQEGNYGEGAIKVKAQLKFVNNYAMNAELAESYVQQANHSVANTEAQVVEQPFKAFVGTADLILVNAVSIRGLAEAGLHPRQELVNGQWGEANPQDIRAYERIGLGMGVDVLKAAIAGIRSLETATKLGGAVVSAAAGVEGTGEQVIKLGTEAVVFVEAVAVAVGTTIATGGGASPETVRHAVSSGLTMTNSGLELLKTVCGERSSCGDDELLMLDIASLLVRVAGSLTSFEESLQDPKKLASIGLQTLDVGIPLLMGVNLDTAYGMTGAPPLAINDGKNAALSLAHVMVTASRSMLDNGLAIPFRDFIKISQRSVTAAREVKSLQSVQNSLATMGLEQAGQLMDLSLDLADSSLDIVDGFTNQNRIDGQALLNVTEQFIDVMCRQSAGLKPLLPASVANVIQQPLHLSQALVHKVSSQALPQSRDEVMRQLQQLIQALAQQDGNLRGCGQASVQLPAAVRAVLAMAAHSLKPLDGSFVDNPGAQVAWALRSVSLSVDALDMMAQQVGRNQLPDQVQDIKVVLLQLSRVFESLGSELDLGNATDVNTQAVLKIAEAIPAAMRDLVADYGAGQAAEVLDLHLVLMRELQVLLNQNQLVAGDLSQVDLFALPVAMIQEIQDLSVLNQCQKSGLSNLSLAMGIARQMTAETQNISLVIQSMDQIYQNIQQCDPSGVSQSVPIVRFMTMLKLMGELNSSPQQLNSIVMTSLPQLLPVFMQSSQRMVASVNTFAQALPLVDFTQDNQVSVLDAVLNRLLSEVENKQPDAVSLRAIREAKSIINHADLNMSGLSIGQDENGTIIYIKELRPDGSLRQIDLILGVAKQFYPDNHPDYNGGLDELIFDVNPGMDFEQLEAEDQASLFTPFWDNVLAQGEVQQRVYKDGNENTISINRLDEIHVEIKNAVSFARFTPRRLYTIASMPEQNATARELDAQMTALLMAEVYQEYSAENTLCYFSDGCALRSVTGSGAFTVQSIHNPQHFALYSDTTESRTSLDNFQPDGSLVQFEGYINQTAEQWNPAWRVAFINTGVLTLLQGDSQETLDVGEHYNVMSPAQIPALLQGVDTFEHRRVVQGQDIWEYRSGQNIIHSYGDGQWEIYRMPDSLPAGTAVPAPQQLLDVAQLELLVKGDRNGVIEDPAGIATQVINGHANVLTVAAENSDETIRIAFVGDQAGQVMIGDNDLATIALSGVSDGQIIVAEQAENGDQLIQQSNGQEMRIMGTVADNMVITQTLMATEFAGQMQQVTIEFCSDGSKAWQSCPQAERITQYYQYALDDTLRAGMNYIDIDMAQRPVITPATGENQAIKHQAWRDIFTFEHELKRNPSVDAINRMKALFYLGKYTGLPTKELDEQRLYIMAVVLDKMLMDVFALSDEFARDTQKQQQWLENDDVSPNSQIVRILAQMAEEKLMPNENFKQRYLALLTYRYRRYLQDLLQFDLTNPLLFNRSLAQKIPPFIDTMGRMFEVGDTSSLSMDTVYACQAIDNVKNYIQQTMLNNTQYEVLESDLKLTLDTFAAANQLACAHADDLLVMFEQLGNRSFAVESLAGLSRQSLIQRLGRAIRLQDINEDDFLRDLTLNSNDLVYFYLNKLMHVNDGLLASLQKPDLTDMDDWVEHLLLLDRFILKINNEKNRRETLSQTVYFTAAPVIALQQRIAELMQQTWFDEYQRLRIAFTLGQSQTASLSAFNALSTHYASLSDVYARLSNSGANVYFTLNPLTQFLSLSFAGNTFQPLQGIVAKQGEWLNRIWLKQPDEVNDWQQKLDLLNQQDEVIRSLKQNQSADTLPENLETFESRVKNKLKAMMDILATNMANDIDDLPNLLTPLSKVRNFVARLHMVTLPDYLQQRVQEILDQIIGRITVDPANSQAEILKLIAFIAAWDGEESLAGAGIANHPAMQNIVIQVGTQLLNHVNNAGGKKEIAAYAGLVGFAAKLGIQSPEISMGQVYPRLGELVREVELALQSSQDVDQVAAYLDLLAEAWLLGWDGTYDLSIARHIVQNSAHEQQACIAEQQCTIKHLRRFIELTTSLELMGADATDYATIIDDMVNSSPLSMSRSIRYGSDLPDLRDAVRADQTGLNGRVVVAGIMQQLGQALPIDDIKGRDAIRLIIAQLKALADMLLPQGHIKPAAAQDALKQAMNHLQSRLDDWLTNIAEHIQQQTNEQGGIVFHQSPDGLANGFNISEEELDTIIIPFIAPEISNDVRIVPANKYRLAAQALSVAPRLSVDSELKLAYRLMVNLPDPAITSEADYRLAVVSQLALYLMESSGEAIDGVLDATTIRQNVLGNLVFTLLNLPVQERPVNTLFEFVQQSLLPDSSNAESACATLQACVLNNSIQLLVNVLDSTLLAARQNQPALTQQDAQLNALLLLQDMAENLSNMAQQNSDDPLGFWTGIGADGMKMSLQLIGGGLNERTLVLSVLDLSQRLLSSPMVSTVVEQAGQNVPAVSLAYRFVSGVTQQINNQLANSGDQHFPVAVARMVNNSLFDVLQHKTGISENLLRAGRGLTQWSLDLVDDDATWTMITKTNIEPDVWLDILLGSQGITRLNYQINQSGLLNGIQLPPALSLMPFIAAKSLLDNKDLWQQEQKMFWVMSDLAADLSNSWFLSVDYQGDFTQEGDRDIARLLRKIKLIDPQESKNLMALKLVGNLGLGAVDVLLPDTTVGNVMTIAWNGAPNGIGLAEILEMGLESTASPELLLDLVTKIPATTSALLQAINSGNGGTAKLLRILSATTTRDDLLEPDKSFAGTETQPQSDNPVLQSVLASLGETRTLFAPQLSDDEHNNHETLGYLRTVPFISMDDNNKPHLSSSDEFIGDMQDMVTLATDYNSGGTSTVVQQVLLGGVDIARLGINALSPLLNKNKVSQVAGIQQRAMFSDLVAGSDTPGFSGVSGGLQTEWIPGESGLTELKVQMFGQLSFPLLGTKAGLMTMSVDGQNSYLLFEAAAEGGVANDLVGGMTGELMAELRAMNESLSIAYWGKAKMSILGMTMGDANASGIISNFPDPAQSTSVDEYMLDLVRHVNIAQCAELETTVLPFPLSLSGISATTTVGGFAEKNDLDVSIGMRVGMSGGMSVPVISSLFGVALSGDITTALTGGLDPANSTMNLQMDNCISPMMTVTLFGTDIPITSNIESQAAIKTVNNRLISDLKFKTVIPVGSVGKALSKLCIGVKKKTRQACGLLKSVAGGEPLWMVFRREGTGTALNPEVQLMIFGAGAFPEVGKTVSNGFFIADLKENTLRQESQAGSWAGWDEGAGNIDICQQDLCALNQFGFAPEAP